MDKHKAWNNNSVIAPKFVGSMTTEGQNPIDEANFQGEFKGVLDRREQQKQCPKKYDSIQYSKKHDLQKKSLTKSSMSEPICPTLNQQIDRNKATRFQIQNQNQNTMNSNIKFQSLNSLDQRQNNYPYPQSSSIKNLMIFN